MVAVKCLAIFGIGTCFLLFPLAKDMKLNLKTINNSAKCKQNRLEMVEELSEFVEFHSKLIQLSQINTIPSTLILFYAISLILFVLSRLIHDQSEFSRTIFAIIILWSIAGICAVMLLLKMKLVKYFQFYFIG